MLNLLFSPMDLMVFFPLRNKINDRALIPGAYFHKGEHEKEGSVVRGTYRTHTVPCNALGSCVQDISFNPENNLREWLITGS